MLKVLPQCLIFILQSLIFIPIPLSNQKVNVALPYNKIIKTLIQIKGYSKQKLMVDHMMTIDQTIVNLGMILLISLLLLLLSLTIMFGIRVYGDVMEVFEE